MLLVVIPLRSDHNDSLCTASYNVRTFTDEDPTTGTAQFSAVSTTVNAHHIKVNPTVRHVYKLHFSQCCMPSLCTHLVTRSAACHTHSHVCQLPATDPTSCDLLQSECCVAVGAGRRNIHTARPVFTHGLPGPGPGPRAAY